MTYLKHNTVRKSSPRRKSVEQPANAAPTKYEQECIAMGRVPTELGGLESALENLAQAVRDYANNATTGDNMLKIFTGEEGAGYYPVLIALDQCSETTEKFLAVGDRIATAFERIADGLGRQKS